MPERPHTHDCSGWILFNWLPGLRGVHYCGSCASPVVAPYRIFIGPHGQQERWKKKQKRKTHVPSRSARAAQSVPRSAELKSNDSTEPKSRTRFGRDCVIRRVALQAILHTRLIVSVFSLSFEQDHNVPSFRCDWSRQWNLLRTVLLPGRGGKERYNEGTHREDKKGAHKRNFYTFCGRIKQRARNETKQTK